VPAGTDEQLEKMVANESEISEKVKLKSHI